ncbi:hypothetical protein BMS3Bbin12_01771 [bacterium BMS3Bbin12]|nr:hypothetical protein BMS3Abin12_01582 [bacterium BMS3Abin12]GBE48591.1 hypothetical protein BMS3Bbin12_01771 [bacterium BMS3Bbin12]GBE50627.1 hypothetical protein BMS3Bbin13_01567 [bacterium BMS3Bbin13]HDJ86533.1 nucleotidyltransferase domain-containing protein [Chromatiales bacterium]
MPVRSLNSPVLKWPDRVQVDGAVRAWAEQIGTTHDELLCAGYFGSYARDDWGVGSDIDLVLVVRESDKPFDRRALDFDATGLPVPAELLVYTQEEWRRLMDEAGRFARTLAAETVWVYVREPSAAQGPARISHRGSSRGRRGAGGTGRTDRSTPKA